MARSTAFKEKGWIRKRNRQKMDALRKPASPSPWAIFSHLKTSRYPSKVVHGERLAPGRANLRLVPLWFSGANCEETTFGVLHPARDYLPPPPPHPPPPLVDLKHDRGKITRWERSSGEKNEYKKNKNESREGHYLRWEGGILHYLES